MLDEDAKQNIEENKEAAVEWEHLEWNPPVTVTIPKKKIRNNLAGFYEDEAELGSDNDDDVVKQIDRNAEDEQDGEDLDRDDEQLIDQRLRIDQYQ